jgi:hypothetical protein
MTKTKKTLTLVEGVLNELRDFNTEVLEVVNVKRDLNLIEPEREELSKLGYKSLDPEDWRVEDEEIEHKLFYEDGKCLNTWDRHDGCTRIRQKGVDEIQNTLSSDELMTDADGETRSMHDFTPHERVDSGKNTAKIYPMEVRLKYGSDTHKVDSKLQYKPDYCKPTGSVPFQSHTTHEDAICESMSWQWWYEALEWMHRKKYFVLGDTEDELQDLRWAIISRAWKLARKRLTSDGLRKALEESYEPSEIDDALFMMRHAIGDTTAIHPYAEYDCQEWMVYKDERLARRKKMYTEARKRERALHVSMEAQRQRLERPIVEMGQVDTEVSCREKEVKMLDIRYWQGQMEELPEDIIDEDEAIAFQKEKVEREMDEGFRYCSINGKRGWYKITVEEK